MKTPLELETDINIAQRGRSNNNKGTLTTNTTKRKQIIDESTISHPKQNGHKILFPITTLHLKQTQSSSSKTRQRSPSPASSNPQIIDKPRKMVLQRHDHADHSGQEECKTKSKIGGNLDGSCTNKQVGHENAKKSMQNGDNKVKLRRDVHEHEHGDVVKSLPKHKTNSSSAPFLQDKDRIKIKAQSTSNGHHKTEILLEPQKNSNKSKNQAEATTTLNKSKTNKTMSKSNAAIKAASVKDKINLFNTITTQIEREKEVNNNNCHHFNQNGNGQEFELHGSEKSSKFMPFEGKNPTKSRPGFGQAVKKMDFDDHHHRSAISSRSAINTKLEFVVPLESHVEIVEGSPLELWVKVKGARKVVWIKKNIPIPHAPPDFIQNSNPIDGIFSLRIKDVFLQDSGVYICEAVGYHDNAERSCWCNVQVVENENEEDDELEIVSVTPIEQREKRKLIVPLIITTPSDNRDMEPLPFSSSDRRGFFANSSGQNSRENSFEDALESIYESPDEELEEEQENSVVPEIEEISENMSDFQGDVLGSTSTSENIEIKENNKKEEISPKNEQPLSKSSQQSSTDQEDEERRSSGGSELCFDELSGSSVENTASGGYTNLGTFRDSLSDNPLSPKFLMGPSNLIVMLGETVYLRVKIWSPEKNNLSTSERTEINWCKQVKGVYQQVACLENRIEISQPTNDLVMMRISQVTYEDSGKYRVKIFNQHGADYHHCLVSVEGPPEPPSTSPTACYDEIHPHNIIISWPCCPFDGGSAILGYILEMKTKTNCSDSESWSIITKPNFKGLCFTWKDPKESKESKPGLYHYFRVCVENSHGKGKYSRISDGLPGLQAPSEIEPVSAFAGRKISSGKKSLSNEEYIYNYTNVELQHKEFLDYYDKHEQLGKGRFGVVFKVTNKATSNSYAGKFVKCRKGSDKDRAELEYKIMNELGYHPKLICLVDAFEMPREIVIVTEMISGGELFERVVADDFTLTERDCVTFLRQICDGVKFIHEKNIMHLDLKPENILCTQKSSNQIKIIDFGLAQHYNPSEPIRVLFGTAEFVSPEIINYETICPATDMWSVGVITYILLSGLSPFLGDDDNDTFSNITTAEFDFDDEAFLKISEDAKDFISSLIVNRKEKRLTASQCLDHKWLALSELEKIDIVLSTDKLKRFLLRRKWQKTGNAIRALGRITTLYSSARRSSSGTNNSSPCSSVSSPIVGASATTTNKESIEEDSVFATPTPTSSIETESHLRHQVVNDSSSLSKQSCQKREDFAIKSKPYDESCRSDSGIGDGETSGGTGTGPLI